MGKDLSKVETTFYFCDGGSCRKAGSDLPLRSARAYLRNEQLWENTHTVRTRCNGRCEDAPTCIVQPGNYWYKHLDTVNVVDIIQSHIDEEKPVSAHLIFQDGWQQMQSEKERPPAKDKFFVEKEDTELGKVFMARGLTSDQYTYPLLVFLMSHKEHVSITKPCGTTLSFSNLQHFEYVDTYKAKLQWAETSFEITLGLVPKTEPLDLQQSKVSVTDFFYSEEKRGVRFKNKLGKHLATLMFEPENTAIWDYCLKVQLNMLSGERIA
ncbi:(2Fe-2S) ferredoxin domain-containing protein [Chondrinema litorale]|uniref:(2Fe-2S) ferredoxin domain-containing protein n=1 Tax=Chondrinema litorale TaxID=2994555 RepID=UPI002542757C|nr:(2Fe-2S) ferredoxin domain-containing protein [Chondrinema litorale]UZR99771.1 (2Fe-2S) ferredoxin domain-containing protein [Chondrinema litorale]